MPQQQEHGPWEKYRAPERVPWDQYVALPDGRYVHVPADATPEQLSQLKDKLRATYSVPSESYAAAHPPIAPVPKMRMQPSYAARALENIRPGDAKYTPTKLEWAALQLQAIAARRNPWTIEQRFV